MHCPRGPGGTRTSCHDVCGDCHTTCLAVLKQRLTALNMQGVIAFACFLDCAWQVAALPGVEGAASFGIVKVVCGSSSYACMEGAAPVGETMHAHEERPHTTPNPPADAARRRPIPGDATPKSIRRSTSTSNDSHKYCSSCESGYFMTHCEEVGFPAQLDCPSVTDCDSH